MAEHSVGIPGMQFTTAPELHSGDQGVFVRRLNWSKVLSLAPLAALLVAFFYLELRLPLSKATKIGQDEDYELSKATLVNHGYKLYSEIWNDQPPLITVTIAKLTKWWPQSIFAPRLMTVCFSALLLGFTYILIRSVNGSLAAAIGSLFLLGSPGFLELSSSVMQELPALGSTVAALCLLWLMPRGKALLPEIVAGIVFGFGLQLKLIGLAYLPLVLVILVVRTSDKSNTTCECWNLTLRRALNLMSAFNGCVMFGLSAAIMFVFLNYATGNPLLLQLRQAWAAHFAHAQSLEYPDPDRFGFDWSVLLKNWDTALPAALGLCLLISALPRRLEFLLPISWLVLAFAVFGIHKPWWAYYYVHTAVPLCWCAGVGLSEGLERLWSRLRKGTPPFRNGGVPGPGQITAVVRRWALTACVSVFILCAGAWTGARVVLEERAIASSQRLETDLVIHEVRRYRPFTHFMFSDRPIYSFHADIPMPPRLAVISLKRFWTGDLSNAGFAAELEDVKPGLILLGKDTREPVYQDLLAREYRLVYEDSANRLYAHESISKKPNL